ncbi:MAG: HAMP domain-containing histidine kinase [Hydrogenothermaceae bacterium]|nr:HAMP domain-containing histidine kinase [Hydrogenothermaceae bacterium]
MFLRATKFYKKIVFRVILLYTSIIFFSFLILFFMVYSFFEVYLDGKISEQLVEKAKSYRILYRQEKLEGLLKQISKEVEILNLSEQFLRIYDRNRGFILSIGDFPSGLEVENFMKEKIDYYAVKKSNEFYIVLYKLSSKHLLIVGKSTHSNNKLLNRLQDIFFLSSGIAFFISILGGFILTATITGKLKKISEIAKNISNSMDLNSRIKITGSGDEIDDLSKVINHLLDRIQVLVNTVKETSESIAHDLKTPIARIRSSIENAMIKNNLSKDCTDLLGYVLEETEIINQMIADLLTISKIESGAYSLKIEDFNLSEAIRRLCYLFKDYASSKSVEVSCDIQDDITIKADSKLLSRAIANIMDNAIKFNMPGGKVAVSLSREQKGISLRIEDTGVGIPPDKINKIFEKFYMVDESRSVCGSGLGLSLVKAVVEAHGGEISVKSKEGKGSTFEIKL